MNTEKNPKTLKKYPNILKKKKKKKNPKKKTKKQKNSKTL